ncbi:MAG: hypothetical protein JST73_01775 [Actinobacteria bacterium]|nr:hypothetical protein [Actinomycetota bacterium]
MTIAERNLDVIGNPVRSESLLRALRSNRNVVILTAWAVVVALSGAVVLVDRLGLDRPFRAGDTKLPDVVGATLGQWWIVTLGAGMIIVAIAFASVACAAAAERGRIHAWSATLLSPWRITTGIWRAQIALIVLALVVAFPVGGIALALGGTTPRQLAIGVAGSFVGAVAANALTIAFVGNARHPIASLIAVTVIVTGVFVVPYAVHVARDRPSGDPVMAIVPLVAVADAAAPLPAPNPRFCAVHGCGWDASDPGDAPLDALRATVRPWSGRIPPWGWTAIGAVVVVGASLTVTRIRVARPARR